MALRDYQTVGEADIFAAWKAGNKNVMYQLVTGGGKTVLFVDIIQKFLMKGKRAMLIAHREELISQAWQKLYDNKIFSGIIKADVKANFSLPCQVASIQTIIRRAKLPHADIVIIDEGHHSEFDNSYGKVLIDHFPNSWVLSVTATPYRLSGKGFTDLYQTLITGPSFKDLVNKGYLVPLRYFAASIPDLTKIKLSKGDYEIDEAAKAMELAPLVESYLEHCTGMSGVVFACNIKHSLKIVDQYRAAGITAAHLDANTPTAERKEILKKFRARIIQIISNVGIITEGFDFPDMQFVQLARPTKSLSLFLQMIGRVTRTDFESIRHATDDEQRRLAVLSSPKPCGIVLDNGGLWKEHGLPDQDFNWHRYFNGIEKRKKGPAEFIDMLEFVAEDEDGRQVRTRQPKEIEGLKLIEVNKIVREQIINLASLKEFDRLLAMFSRMPKLGTKAGYAAYKAYKDYCRKNNFEMSAEVWDYIIKKVCTDPELVESKALSERDQNISVAHDQYGESNTDEFQKLQRHFVDIAEARTAYVKKIKVPLGYLKRERSEYIAAKNGHKLIVR